MTTTFKELPIGARFYVYNIEEIIYARGDNNAKQRKFFAERIPYRWHKCFLIKRDSGGGHILYYADDDYEQSSSVYYRIEPDNVVETI